MFERDWPLWCANDVYIFLLGSSDPVSKFFRVGDCSGKQYDAYMIWQHDDDLFPNHTSLYVPSADRIPA